MQRLEVSGAVRPIYGSLGVKRLIIHCTFFPFSVSHFAQADVFLCLATAPVRIFPSPNVSLQSCAEYHTTPPIQLQASTLLGDTPH